MKKRIATGALALLWSAAANAQPVSGVVLYGIIDASVRATSGMDDRNNASGGSFRSLISGMGPQTRWGIRGSESIGNGLRAGFNLEQGFELDIGGQVPGVPFWDRQSNVQLEGPWGRISLGRHNTLILESAAMVDPIYFRAASINPNLLVTALLQHRTGVNWGTSGQVFASHRQGNSMQYNLPVGNFTARVMYSLGESPTSDSASSSYGLGLNYAEPRFTLTAAAMQYKDPTGRLKMTAFNAGVAYRPGSGRRFVFNVSHNVGDTSVTSQTTNNLVAAGLTHPVTAQIEFTTGVYHVSRKRTGLADDGFDRVVNYLDYLLSKRTKVYAELDHTRWKGGYQGAANRSTATGFSLGITHTF